MKEEIFTKFKKVLEENKNIPLDCFQTDNSSSMKIMGCVPSDTAQPSVVYQNSAKASKFYVSNNCNTLSNYIQTLKRSLQYL